MSGIDATMCSSSGGLEEVAWGADSPGRHRRPWWWIMDAGTVVQV